MQIHNVEQKSEEWFALRKQYPLTASHAQAIGNNGKGLETLCIKVMSEKYSSAEQERFSNDHTDRGNELEDQARQLYELETGTKVEQIGFVTDEEISKVGGASPDGDVVGTDGLIEIKCFEDKVHFQMVIEKNKNGFFEIDTKHLWQMQQQMLFTGKKWVDYIPYNPNYKQSLLIQRVLPDPTMQEKIKEGLKKGEAIISDIEASLK